MKHYFVIVAAVLFCTLAASCGKKTDDQAKMADSMSGGGQPSAPVYIVTIAAATWTGAGATPGISITAGNTATKSATITVKDTSGTTTYIWRAYAGSSNVSTLLPGVWSNAGNSTWDVGSVTPTWYWFPQYMGGAATSPSPASATNFSTINVTAPSGTTCTAYANVDGNTNANIKITVQAGSGEPGK